jgi:uncharacterized repeat protein (TIGR01451 family)
MKMIRDSMWKRFCRPGIAGVVLLAACAALPMSALAQTQSDVAVELTVEQVIVSPDGKETLASAEKTKPGDTLLYTANHRNVSKFPVQRVQANLPIPAGMEYLADTARPDGAKASTDGVHFFPMPLKRMVKVPDGTEREELVPLSEYRKLRWDIGSIEPGQSAVVSARVRVLPADEPKQSR